MRWHPAAAHERGAIRDDGERQAIQRAIIKLEREGPLLTFPHSSAIAGTRRIPLRKLRPRQGRSRWRVLYRRSGDEFIALAIAPEAGIDRRGFVASVARAEQRHLDSMGVR